MTNQYEPWKELGMTELEYWKMRYLQMRQVNGILEEAIKNYRSECETVAPDALLKRERRLQLFAAPAKAEELMK